jgi:hypothetical protein
MQTRSAVLQRFLLLTLLLLVYAEAGAAPSAITMRMTMYDDGRSCPAECDAHVVLPKTNNGTPNAYLPTSNPGTYAKCRKNEECRICFDENPQHCMTVMYRGTGPHKNTFDFTPAFYEQQCAKADIPKPLATQCSALHQQAKRLEGRLNCFQNPEHEKCQALVQQAQQQQSQDLPLYNACRKEGEDRFNRRQPAEKQRSEECAYEKQGTGGPNSQGKRWRKLLPGVCRDNTFVGRDGLDCCTGNLFHDGPLDVECRTFYPEQ